jgi:hypothetical protein
MKTLTKLLTGLAAGFALQAHAAELKSVGDIEVPALVAETQRMSTRDGIHLVWWLPPEYWEASLAGSDMLSESARKSVIDLLRGYSMLAVVQAGRGPMGNVTF